MDNIRMTLMKQKDTLSLGWGVGGGGGEGVTW